MNLPVTYPIPVPETVDPEQLGNIGEGSYAGSVQADAQRESSPPDQLRILKRSEAVWHLIEQEASYVEDIKVVYNLLYQPLSQLLSSNDSGQTLQQQLTADTRDIPSWLRHNKKRSRLSLPPTMNSEQQKVSRTSVVQVQAQAECPLVAMLENLEDIVSLNTMFSTDLQETSYDDIGCIILKHVEIFEEKYVLYSSKLGEVGDYLRRIKSLNNTSQSVPSSPNISRVALSSTSTLCPTESALSISSFGSSRASLSLPWQQPQDNFDLQVLQVIKLAEKSPKLGKRDLDSFLKRPMRRIFNYPLHVQSILKFTEEDHPDYENLTLAYSKCDSIANAVDTRSIDIEKSVAIDRFSQMFDWPRLLGDPEFQLSSFTVLLGRRQVVKVGKLLLCSSAKPLSRKKVEAFLFNDILVFLTSRDPSAHGKREDAEKMYRVYYSPIDTSDIIVLPAKNDEGIGLLGKRHRDGIKLLILDDKKNVLTLKSDDPANDYDWARAFEQVSNEHYNTLHAAIANGYSVGKHTSLIDPVQREKLLEGSNPKLLSTFLRLNHSHV